MAKKRIRMENAPDWYDTPLDQLDFEWSHEEELELERYCEKIHKNIAEEEMTPRQRFEATLAGEEKDRLFIASLPLNVYGVTTLDSHANALKPIDVYRNPKLLVKSHLAFVARFKADWLQTYTLAYTEDLWGANSRLIEYGNPVMVGDPPIKSMADLEGLEVPDPKKHGLYPGYLWAVRELKRIFVEYDLDDKLPLAVSCCPDAVSIAMLGMTSITGFMILSRKDPELCKRCVEMADEFLLSYLMAAFEMGAHAIQICYGIGWLPVKGNEWTLDHHEKVAKTVGPKGPIYITASVPGDMPWFPLVMEKGIMGPDGYVGWMSGHEVDYKWMIDGGREHNIFVSCLFSDKVLLDGPTSAIEEEIKEICDYGKPYPKFAIAIGAIDYWTPQAHVDAAFAACKKYGKY